MFIPKHIKKFAKLIKQFDGTCFVVGGAVRDHFMGQDPQDFDLVVTGMTQDQFLMVAHQFDSKCTKVIGNAPVFMVMGEEVALARKEVSTGDNKHSFEFIADKSITIVQDLFRRDFTINAMAWDIMSSFLIDPFCGREDIERGIIRPVSKHFTESPERVFRGLSFASRFDFEFVSTFTKFAKKMKPTFHSIPKEQIWRHFEKGMLKAVKPSRWLRGLVETQWIEFFPELEALIGCPQEPDHHPEGDVFEHTCFVLGETVGCSIEVMLSAVCHDMGKPDTTTSDENGKIASRGHQHYVEPVERFLNSIGCFDVRLRESVLSLVRCHMRHINFTNQKPSRKAVNNIIQDVKPATVEQLAELMKADKSGRPPLAKGMPIGMKRVLEVVPTLKQTEKGFDQFLKGNHLIELGLKPSPQFGRILKLSEEAQLDGKINSLEEAIEFAKQQI